MAFWNAARVCNYMKALGMKPSKWDENCASLACHAEITMDEFMNMDPISYGVLVWGTNIAEAAYGNQWTPSTKIQDVLGKKIYKEFLPIYNEAVGQLPKEQQKIGLHCDGCAEDQPNQLAHMQPGGCLHNPGEFSY